MPALIADTALLPSGWTEGVRVEWDAAGTITAIDTAGDAAGIDRVDAIVPGMPNLHCHAFQRAMAGLAERAGPAGDDFWRWRDVMYRFLATLSPDQVEAIAAQVYVEMLKAGYTAVAEFHYVHNTPDGTSYDDPAEMAGRIATAAAAAGIRLTLLPVLYQASNFGGAPPTAGQRRFVLSLDAFNGIVESLHRRHTGSADIRIGIAPHSLRAVTPAALAEAVAALDALDPNAPLHIHAAEQIKEVEDSVAWSGLRPVEWLLENAAIGPRWTPIHCTHMSADETARLAASGATAGLCPTTEANLGDGLFPVPDYLGAGGGFGIGSDSNVGVSPAEELRWLDYGARLTRRKRNVIAAEGESIGARLWRGALAGGARAVAQPVGALAIGNRADLLVLDREHPALAGRSGDRILDSLVFGDARGAIRHVMVAGRWTVRDGGHRDEARIARAYRAALRRLG